MPRRVTAIQSYWPLTTLTKPFSAVCALPKLPRRFARPTRMPPLHALDTQALARPSGGGGGGRRRRSVNEREKKEGKKQTKRHPRLDKFPNWATKRAGEPSGVRRTSHSREKRKKNREGHMRASIESLPFFPFFDIGLASKMAACLHFPLGLRVVCRNKRRRMSARDTRTSVPSI